MTCSICVWAKSKMTRNTAAVLRPTKSRSDARTAFAENAKQHPLGMLLWGERGAGSGFCQCLLHHLTDLVEVVMRHLCGNQVFGAAVFAFKHGVDHAQFTQLV